MGKYCLGPYSIKSTGLGESNGVLIDPSKTRRVVTVGLRAETVRPSIDAILLHSIERGEKTVQYWDVPSELGRTYTSLVIPNQIIITDFEKGMLPDAIGYGSQVFNFEPGNCKLIFEFGGRTFEVSATLSEDYGLFEASSVGFGGPLDEDYRSMPVAPPSQEAEETTANLPAIPITQLGKYITPEGKAKWGSSDSPTVSLPFANSPAIARLQDGRSIIAYESSDSDGNIVLSATILSTSVDKNIVHYRSLSMGKLVSGSNPLKFETFDDLYIETLSNVPTSPNMYVGFLSGPLKGKHCKVLSFERIADTYNDGRPTFRNEMTLQADAIEWNTANDLHNIRWFLSNGPVPVTSETLVLTPQYTEGAVGYTAQIAHISVAVAENNKMPSDTRTLLAEQSICIAYQAFVDSKWNVYVRHLIYTNRLLYKSPTYVAPYNPQQPLLSEARLSDSGFSELTYEVKSVRDLGSELCASFTTTLTDGRPLYNCEGQEGVTIYGPCGLSLQSTDAGLFARFFKELCVDSPVWVVGTKFTGDYPPTPVSLGFNGADVDDTRYSYGEYPTGVSITSLGGGYQYPEITSVTNFGGNLVGVGPFSLANSVAGTKGVFQWSAGTVSSMGNGITASGFYPTGVKELNSTLYIWGSASPYLVSWNGSSWVNRAGGAIADLVYYDSKLIKTDNVKLYWLNPAPSENWTDWLGTAFTAPNCKAIYVYGSLLFFIAQPTSSTADIYSSDGAVITGLTSVEGTAKCFIEFDGRLIVGGNFSNQVGSEVRLGGIIAYDGTSWYGLGNPTIDVQSLSATADSLFVAGHGTSSDEIWVYSKTSGNWRQIATSTDTITAIHYFGSSLFAAFNEETGTSHTNLAAWLEEIENYSKCMEISESSPSTDWCYYNATCYQHFVQGDLYCPSPYLVLKYTPEDLYVLERDGVKATRVLYHLSAAVDEETFTSVQSDVVTSSVAKAPGVQSLSVTCSSSPSSLSYGIVTSLEQHEELSFTLTAIDGRAIDLSITGTDADSFDFVSGEALEKTKKLSSCGTGCQDIVVRFHPSTTGSKTALIVSDCDVTIALSGSAYTDPVCNVSTSLLSFGYVLGQSKTRTFVISNAGGGSLVGSAVFSVSAAAFTIVGDASFNLAHGQEKTITVQFLPSILSLGEKTATIECDTCSVAVFGVSSETIQCDVSPQDIDVGSIAVGSSISVEITITNSSLDISQGDTVNGDISMEDNGNQFSITDGDGYFELAPTQSHTVTVLFSPTEANSWSRKIYMGEFCPIAVITGEGVLSSACACTPETLSFGTIPIGEESQSYVTISHLGGASLSLFVEIEQTGSEFSILSGSGYYTLTTGQRLVVQVGCTPTSESELIATLKTGCQDVLITATGQFLFNVGDILERDLEGYEGSFLKRASILVTYDGDLSEKWTQDKADLEFFDNVPTLEDLYKGLWNFPYPLSGTTFFGADPVEVNGDITKWVYFDGHGPLSLFYGEFGVPADPEPGQPINTSKPHQSDPILINEDAMRPKVVINNRSNIIIAYEKSVSGTTQIAMKGTGDFAQDSIVGPKSQRTTKPVSSEDFRFSCDVTLVSDGLNQLCDLVVDHNDIVHLVWQSNRDGYWNIYYANATNYFEQVKITSTTSRSGFPSIDVDTDGNVFVVYHDNRFGPYQIMMAKKDEHRYLPLLEQDAYLAGYRSGVPHYTNTFRILVSNEWKSTPSEATMWCVKNDSQDGDVGNYVFQIDPVTGEIADSIDCGEYQVVTTSGRLDRNYAITNSGQLLLLTDVPTYLGQLSGVTASASASAQSILPSVFHTSGSSISEPFTTSDSTISFSPPYYAFPATAKGNYVDATFTIRANSSGPIPVCIQPNPAYPAGTTGYEFLFLPSESVTIYQSGTLAYVSLVPGIAGRQVGSFVIRFTQTGAAFRTAKVFYGSSPLYGTPVIDLYGPTLTCKTITVSPTNSLLQVPVNTFLTFAPETSWSNTGLTWPAYTVMYTLSLINSTEITLRRGTGGTGSNAVPFVVEPWSMMFSVGGASYVNFEYLIQTGTTLGDGCAITSSAIPYIVWAYSGTTQTDPQFVFSTTTILADVNESSVLDGSLLNQYTGNTIWGKALLFGPSPANQIVTSNTSGFFNVVFDPSWTITMGDGTQQVVRHAIGPAESGAVRITYAPESKGNHQLVLTVVGDNGVETITINGTSNSAPQGRLNRNSITRAVEYGTDVAVTDYDVITVTNIGGTSPSGLFFHSITSTWDTQQISSSTVLSPNFAHGGTALGASQSGEIRVYYITNTSLLDPGLYTETFTATFDDSSHSNSHTLVFTVTLDVNYTSRPVITVSPTSISKTVTYAVAPTSETLLVGNSGDATLQYEIVPSANWIQLTGAAADGIVRGSILSLGADVTITIDFGWMNPGTYSSLITVRSAATSILARNNPQTIPVTLVVNDEIAEIDVYPNGTSPQITVNYTKGSLTLPPAISWLVKNIGGSTLNYTYSVSSPHVTSRYEPDGITHPLLKDLTQEIESTFNASIASLPVGAYDTTYVFNANGSTTQLTRVLRLVVGYDSVPDLRTSVSQLIIHVVENETPAISLSDAFSVWNANTDIEATYTISAQADSCIADNWITGVSPALGVSQGAQNSHHVMLDTSSLSASGVPATCSGTLTIEDASALGASRVINVLIITNPENAVSVSPSVLTLSIAEERDHPDVQVAVYNVASVGVECTISRNATSSFVQTHGPFGVEADSSSSITVSFSTANLAVGEYSDYFDIVPVAIIGTRSVPLDTVRVYVSLSVIAWTLPGVDVYPSSIVKRARTNQVVYPSHLSIYNGGTFDITFTASVASSWLLVSSASVGVAIGEERLLEVNYDITLLLPGVYSSSVIITIPCEDMSGSGEIRNEQVVVPVLLTVLDEEVEVVDMEVDAAGKLWVCLVGRKLDESLDSLILRNISTLNAAIISEVTLFEDIDAKKGGLAVTTENTFYVVVYKDSACQLYTSISPTTQQQGGQTITTFDFSYVADLAVDIVSLSADEEDNLYGLSEDADIYLINKTTGALTLLTTIYPDPYSPPYATSTIYGIGHFITTETTAYGDAGVYHIYLEFYDNPKFEGQPQVVADSRIDTSAFLATESTDPYQLLVMSVGSGIYLLPGQSGYISFSPQLFRPGATGLSYPFGFDKNQTYYPKVFVIDKFGSVHETTSSNAGSVSCNECSRLSPNTINTSLCAYSFVYVNDTSEDQYMDFRVVFYSDIDKRDAYKLFDLSYGSPDLLYVMVTSSM